MRSCQTCLYLFLLERILLKGRNQWVLVMPCYYRRKTSWYFQALCLCALSHKYAGIWLPSTLNILFVLLSIHSCSFDSYIRISLFLRDTQEWYRSVCHLRGHLSALLYKGGSQWLWVVQSLWFRAAFQICPCSTYRFVWQRQAPHWACLWLYIPFQKILLQGYYCFYYQLLLIHLSHIIHWIIDALVLCATFESISWV